MSLFTELVEKIYTQVILSALAFLKDQSGLYHDDYHLHCALEE